MFFKKKINIKCEIDLTDMEFSSFIIEKKKLVFNIFKKEIMPLKGTYEKGTLTIVYKKNNYIDKYGENISRSAIEKYDIKEILKINPKATVQDIKIDDFSCCGLSERLGNELRILNLFKQ